MRSLKTTDAVKLGSVYGRVSLKQVLVDANGSRLFTWGHRPIRCNQICYDWGVVAQALFRGLQDGKDYKISGMYLEFDNSGSDVDPVPTISRATTSEYYLGLSGTADFLRVPLIATSSSNSDDDLYSEDNVAVFYAQSAGTTGNRDTSPLTFSDVANSRIYGAALVAFRDESDITQDLVVSRIYFDPGEQAEKVAGSQIGVNWSLTFG